MALYQRHNTQPVYAPDAQQIGSRSLKNAALNYLMLVGDTGIELAWQQFKLADNMTDKAAALSAWLIAQQPLSMQSRHWLSLRQSIATKHW